MSNREATKKFRQPFQMLRGVGQRPTTLQQSAALQKEMQGRTRIPPKAGRVRPGRLSPSLLKPEKPKMTVSIPFWRGDLFRPSGAAAYRPYGRVRLLRLLF